MKKLFLFILVIISANLFAIECDYEYPFSFLDMESYVFDKMLVSENHIALCWRDTVTDYMSFGLFHVTDSGEIRTIATREAPVSIYDIGLADNSIHFLHEYCGEKYLNAYGIEDYALTLIESERLEDIDDGILETDGLIVLSEPRLFLFGDSLLKNIHMLFFHHYDPYYSTWFHSIVDTSSYFKCNEINIVYIDSTKLTCSCLRMSGMSCNPYSDIEVTNTIDADFDAGSFLQEDNLWILKSDNLFYATAKDTVFPWDFAHFYVYHVADTIPFSHDYTRIECVGDYLVLMNEEVCDVYSKPDSFGEFELVGSLPDVADADFVECNFGKIYYYSHETGLHIIDVADSSFLHSTYKPVIMSGKIKQLQSENNRIVVRNNTDILYSCDFSDPSDMTFDDYIKLPSVNDYDIFEDDLIASSDSGLFHYTIIDDGELVFHDRISDDYQNVCFNESGVFATSLDDRSIHFMEFNIYDRMEEIAHFDYDGNITCLHLTEDKLYTITDDSILTSYDITDIECPLLIGEFVHNPIHRIKIIGNYTFVVDTTNYDRLINFGCTFMINGESSECIDTFPRVSDVLIKDSFVCLLHNVGRTPLRGEFITLRYDGISEFDTIYSSDLPNYYDKVCATESGMVGQYFLLGIYAGYDHMNTSLGFSYIDDLLTEPSEIELYRGWNAVSYPYSPEKTIANACLGTEILSAFEYDNETCLYRNSDTLTAGTGYWFLCDSTYESAQLYGRFPVDSLTLELHTGWNLVGGLFHSIAVSELDTDGIIMPIFEHNPLTGSYEEATVIEPFKAYWIFTDRDMELELR